jgi:Extensin-like protein C-terminus
MSRCVQWSLSGVAVVAGFVALAGCSHFMSGEREAWRHDAEVACLNSGAVKEGPERVRIAPISGPGICGADFPLRVSSLGQSQNAPLSYDDEAVRPPGAIPDGALPRHWPLVQSHALPPPSPGAPAEYGAPQSGQAQSNSAQGLRWQVGPPPASTPGTPMSIYAPGVPVPDPDDADEATDFHPAPPRPYENAPGVRGNAPPVAAYPPPSYPPSRLAPTYPPPPNYSSPNYSPRGAPAPSVTEEAVPLGPPRAPPSSYPPPQDGNAVGGAVEVRPAATLACPIVSALDQWITSAVQPAALRWFRQPVAEIKQISAYSCRGMNGDPNARISEHAFGNALDIAEFTLADGHKISVQYGWRGPPEEQGFLHDVQLAACESFSTVLAPGANIYHYNHIHVDLMRHTSSRHICEPAAIPGEVVAERARARYAARHDGDPGITGAIRSAPPRRGVLGYSGEDDGLPVAVPGLD